MKCGDTVRADGADWTIMAIGATERAATYVHLASKTVRIQQKNGSRPIQVCGWLRDGTLLDNP